MLTKSEEEEWIFGRVAILAPSCGVKVQWVFIVFLILHHLDSGHLDQGARFDCYIGATESVLFGTSSLQVAKRVTPQCLHNHAC